MTENQNIKDLAEAIKNRLDKPVALIGMMGSGKSHIGALLARALGLEFVDSDRKIEEAAGCSIAEIFERDGEQRFRDAEKRIIADLLETGPIVLATGGGAIVNESTADAIWSRAISIWIDADIDALLERVMHKKNRPLLAQGDPRDIIEELLEKRRPIYAKADITVRSDAGAIADVVDGSVKSLHEFLCEEE